MGKYQIPRNVGSSSLWGGLDFKGWLGASPFIAFAIFSLYYSYGEVQAGHKNWGYFVFGFGAFVGLMGYALNKPLPQLTERPYQYLFRLLRAKRAQKKFNWGRKH